MRVPRLLLMGLVLFSATAAEDDGRLVADTQIVPDTLAGWRAVVAAHAGAYTATIVTADERAGLTVGQQFAVVILPNDQRLGGVGLDLPTGRRVLDISLGQGGKLGFSDLIQLPLISGVIERHRDQTALRMTLTIASGIDVTGHATADLVQLDITTP